ncbi:MAG: transcriptional repressor [Phycisphaerae bacterium]|nr:transcriptional repressor [Phycisphaerae bacterium]
MKALESHAKNMLKAAGLYCTRARLCVIMALLRENRPITQEQITQALDAPFDRVTIYRTLDSLGKADLVHRVFLEERACHYELSHHCSKTQCHPHFTCTQCGQTHCLTDLKLPLAHHHGYVIQRQQVRLAGLCPQCR